MCNAPAGRKPIKCKKVFETKLTVDGHIEHFKARLVAKDCSHQPGVDFDETLTLTVKHNLEIDQMDADTAFLHPELTEEIYMELPKDNQLKCATCRLLKSKYGLKQASKVWNKRLYGLLKDLGFCLSLYDPCEYFKISNNKIVITVVYVDDLLIF